MEPRKNELPDPPAGEPCTIELDGKRLEARRGEPLMVALIAAGIETASRSVKYHRPRGAYCMAASCGQCWMRIDDLPNRPACATPVHDGMVALRENAFPSADFDIFRATDKLFGALDHHRLGTTPFRPLNQVVQDTARRMAGLGELSQRAPSPAPALGRESVELVVVGAGPAGLAAARAAAAAGLSTLLLDARPAPGGQLRTRLWDDVPELAALPAAARAALERGRGRLWCGSAAIGVYKEEGRARPELLVRQAIGEAEDRLVIVGFETMVLANGGYEQTPLFEANDLPGHYGARAFAELVLGRRVLPGRRVVVVDGGVETAARLHARLAGLGIDAVRVRERADEEGRADLYAGYTVVAARGGTHVKGVELAPAGPRGPGGERLRLSCEVIASALPVAPAFELGRQAGCALDHRPEDGGFALAVERGTGATSVAGVYAAGDVTGATSPSEARRQGEVAALSAVLALRDDRAARARRDELASQLGAEATRTGVEETR